GQCEGAGVLLQRHRCERPQYKTDKIADRPDNAVGGAADAGRKDLRRKGYARPPETEKAETPGQAKHPKQQMVIGKYPQWNKDRAFDQHHNKGDAPADPVGEPAGDSQTEKPDNAPAYIEEAVFRCRPVLLSRQVIGHPTADRAEDAAAAAGDKHR